jgi:hypothetical protein
MGKHWDVQVGQVWSVMASNVGIGRTEFTVDEVKPDAAGVLSAFGHAASGKRIHHVSVVTLRAGRRGARLIRHADGRLAE